jgi:hypothetical protein
VRASDFAEGGRVLHAGWRSSEAAGANMVSVSWTADRSAQFEVDVRGQSGGWQSAGVVASDQQATGPDPGTLEARRATRSLVSEPLWVGNATRVRIRLVRGTARDVHLQQIDAPAGPPPDTRIAGALTLPQPGVVSRRMWGADESLRLRQCPEGPVYTDNVKLAVVHHTAGSNNYGPGDTPRIVRGLYAYAVNVLHYCDTHYNFFVDKYGQIFEGRYGGIDKPVLGAHTTGANYDTVGVALIGNYDVTTAPPAMIRALDTLLAWKLSWHGVDLGRSVAYTTLTGTDRWPAGSTHILPPIVGHRDPGITDCPGRYVYALLPAIRLDVGLRVARAPMDVLRVFAATPGQPRLIVATAYGALYSAGGEQQFHFPGAWPGRDIVRDVALVPGGAGGYMLDAYGGIHRFGNVPALTGGPYWRGVPIARDLVLRPGGGAYVLDGWGGIHPVGGAPPIVGGARWPGFDIARKLVLVPGGAEVLDGYGGIHPTSGVPALHIGGYWRGWDIARDFVPAATGTGFYVLDGLGGVWPTGGAPGLHAPYFRRNVARSLLLVPGGGYTLDDSGKLNPFGTAPAVAQARSTYSGAPAITTPYVARAAALG